MYQIGDDPTKEKSYKIAASFDSNDANILRIPTFDNTSTGIYQNKYNLGQKPFIIKFKKDYFLFKDYSKALGRLANYHDLHQAGLLRDVYNKIRFHERVFKISKCDLGYWIEGKALDKPHFIRNWGDCIKVIYSVIGEIDVSFREKIVEEGLSDRQEYILDLKEKPIPRSKDYVALIGFKNHNVKFRIELKKRHPDWFKK
jgi:hypothetical protein